MVKQNLLNQSGGITPLGVALYIEKTLSGTIGELPVSLLQHIDQSAKCRSKISFLLEHELEKRRKADLLTSIKTGLIRARNTAKCNASLQLISPLNNEFFIQTIQFKFEQPVKHQATLYIIDNTENIMLKTVLQPGSTEYNYVPHNLQTGLYHYVIGTATTSLKGSFYYTTKMHKVVTARPCLI